MKKRIFAGALALLMIIGLLPVSSMVKKPMEVKAEDKVYSIPDVQSGTSYKDGAVIDNFFTIGGDMTASQPAKRVNKYGLKFDDNNTIKFTVNSSATINIEWTVGSTGYSFVLKNDTTDETVTTDKVTTKNAFQTNTYNLAKGTYSISRDLKALYIASITVTVKDAATSGYKVTVIDGDSKTTATYPEGDTLKLSAKGENFLYWVNSNGVKVAETTTKDIPVYYSDTYTAVYGKTGNKVTYYTPYGGELATYYADENFTVPEVPTRYGYKATGWDKDIDSVKEALKSGNVEVRPVYDNDTSLTFSITVDTSAIDSAIPKAENVEVNKEVKASVTSDDFAYWSDENGNPLSYNSTYYFHANRSVTVKAVKKSGSGVEKTGVITYIDYKSKTIIFEYTVPDTYTMKFAGVLASTNKANVESATVDNRPAGVYKLGADEAKCSSYKTFRYTLKNNGADTWYTRPVLTYIDDSGVEHTIVGTTVYEMN